MSEGFGITIFDKDLRNSLNKAINQTPKVIRKAITESVAYGLREAKKATPVLTGKTKKSWGTSRSKSKNFTGRIVPYKKNSDKRTRSETVVTANVLDKGSQKKHKATYFISRGVEPRVQKFFYEKLKQTVGEII
jgi:hypothetical protein